MMTNERKQALYYDVTMYIIMVFGIYTIELNHAERRLYNL